MLSGELLWNYVNIRFPINIWFVHLLIYICLTSRFFMIHLVTTLDVASRSLNDPTLLCHGPVILWALPFFLAKQHVPNTSCTLPVPVQESAISLKSLVPLRGEWYLGTKDWIFRNQVFLAVTRLLLLLRPLGGESQTIYMHAHSHTYTPADVRLHLFLPIFTSIFISIFLSIYLC